MLRLAYTRDELAAMVDQVAAERDAAVGELVELRAQVRADAVKIRGLMRTLADEPSEVARLTAECTDWSARCGLAEMERDQAVHELDLIRRGRLALAGGAR